jgi:phosphomannomutase
MVTGSHIPDDRNGLKFYTSSGEITKTDETVITANYARISKGGSPPLPVMEKDATCVSAYSSRFVSFFGAKCLSGLRIGVYEHSSAAREVLADVLSAIGAEIVSLGRADRFVPVDTEAVDAETRAMLAGWASEHKLDAIVSTDGDADRPMLTDTVVTPVSSNTLVDQMGDFRVYRTRIGSPYVIAGMEALPGKNVVGYEANGGFLLGFSARRDGRVLAPLMTRDSLLPIIAPLAAAREAGQSMEHCVDALPPRRTAADRLTEVPTEVSGPFVERLKMDTMLRNGLCDGLGEMTKADTTDGYRMTFGDVTVHLRPSGNAPEMRVYIEADSSEAAQDVLTKTLKRARDLIAAQMR